MSRSQLDSRVSWFIVLALMLGVSPKAMAATPKPPVRFQTPSLTTNRTLVGELQDYFAGEDVREIRVRSLSPRVLIVRLFARGLHNFETVRVGLTGSGSLNSVTRHYRPGRAEHLTAPLPPRCPDEATQFISFAPNEDLFEQGIATDVAQSARQHGLKTVLLLGAKATRHTYLSYMSCPNLVGNFYDGDSNPTEMITADDSITAEDFKTVLNKSFRYRVTNIWLACEAFNDPMRGAIINEAQSQKFAAGINNLLVGPSDRTAACAMKAALDGQPMKTAFKSCYAKFDDHHDQWGFDGQGSDQFGK